MNEIYVSTDIETDGPVPGLNSMLSFASAAYLADKTLVRTFSANLETLGVAATSLGGLSQEPAAARGGDAAIRLVA
jgi:hypothetical protein